MHGIFDNASARKVDERADAASAPQARSWRDTIRIHPAAEVFPLMDKAELAKLAADIAKNGLISPIALWLANKDAPAQLIEGRNRLDALELELERAVRVTSRTSRGRTAWILETDDDDGYPERATDLLGNEGAPLDTPDFVVFGPEIDPYAYVTSANLHRRHLTAEQKREVIAKLIKIMPERSDRQIGKMTKTDHRTVGSVRAEGEATGEISPVEKRIGADGKARQLPVRKPRTSPKLTGESTDSDAKKTGKVVEAATIVAGTPMSISAASRNDIGPESSGELARLRARVEELGNSKRRLEIENIGQRSEIAELKSRLKPSDARDERIAELARKITAFAAHPAQNVSEIYKAAAEIRHLAKSERSGKPITISSAVENLDKAAFGKAMTPPTPGTHQ